MEKGNRGVFRSTSERGLILPTITTTTMMMRATDRDREVGKKIIKLVSLSSNALSCWIPDWCFDGLDLTRWRIKWSLKGILVQI